MFEPRMPRPIDDDQSLPVLNLFPSAAPNSATRTDTGGCVTFHTMCDLLLRSIPPSIDVDDAALNSAPIRCR
jgi:hypothetical protein